MNFQEYNKKMGNVISDLQGPKIAETMVGMAITATTLIKKRVQEKGINAEGQKYKPYSTKDTLVGCKTFIQKSACQALLGSKDKRKNLKWRTVDSHRLAILKGGYKKIRELQGRQTDHVDFSVTNNMWNDINVISTPASHQKGIAIIGAKQEIEKKKLSGNTKRRGDILDLSLKEQSELKKYYGINVLQIFKDHGLT